MTLGFTPPNFILLMRPHFAAPAIRLCVPKIGFCNIDGEGHQGQVVR